MGDAIGDETRECNIQQCVPGKSFNNAAKILFKSIHLDLNQTT